MPYLPPAIVGLQVFGFQNSISPYGWCSFWRFSAAWERSSGPRLIFKIQRKRGFPSKPRFSDLPHDEQLIRNVLLNNSYMMKDVAKCWTTSGERNVGGERRLFDNRINNKESVWEIAPIVIVENLLHLFELSSRLPHNNMVPGKRTSQSRLLYAELKSTRGIFFK